MLSYGRSKLVPKVIKSPLVEGIISFSYITGKTLSWRVNMNVLLVLHSFYWVACYCIMCVLGSWISSRSKREHICVSFVYLIIYVWIIVLSQTISPLVKGLFHWIFLINFLMRQGDSHSLNFSLVLIRFFYIFLTLFLLIYFIGVFLKKNMHNSRMKYLFFKLKYQYDYD